MNRLLIIDDDRELSFLLAEQMRTEDFILDAALDGKKGLELVSSGSYARVIRLHGGTIEAANASGCGLLVTIRLPLSAPLA